MRILRFEPLNHFSGVSHLTPSAPGLHQHLPKANGSFQRFSLAGSPHAMQFAGDASNPQIVLHLAGEVGDIRSVKRDRLQRNGVVHRARLRWCRSPPSQRQRYRIQTWCPAGSRRHSSPHRCVLPPDQKAVWPLPFHHRSRVQECLPGVPLR